MTSSKNRSIESQTKAPILTATSNPFLEEVEEMWSQIRAEFPRVTDRGLRGWWAWLSSNEARMKCLEKSVALDEKYAFAIPNEQALQKLVSLGKLIEIGAGTGYWGALLRARGCDIRLFDIAPTDRSDSNQWFGKQKTWTTVNSGTPRQLKNSDRTLLLCWPPFTNDMASKCLQFYTGDTLAYIGHCATGNTGDPEFHKELHDNWILNEAIVIPSWRDFKSRRIAAIPNDISWAEASMVYEDYRDKLFIFQRKAKLVI